MNKIINNNNIIIDRLDAIAKPKLIENKEQLSDVKKTNFGFNLKQSVIDVEQAGYGICYGYDILYTYGIDPCCGLVLCDENVRILFHLDGTITSEDVLYVTDRINLSRNTMVIVIPGASCGIEGSFNYKKMEETYRKKGYEVIEQRIPATFGFVTLESDKVTIGTGINRNLDVILQIPKKKTQEQSQQYDNDTIRQLISLKQELLNANKHNIRKK